jgi:hypothetical protein
MYYTTPQAMDPDEILTIWGRILTTPVRIGPLLVAGDSAFPGHRRVSLRRYFRGHVAPHSVKWVWSFLGTARFLSLT